MCEMSRQGLADGVIVMEVRIDDPRVRALDAAGVPLTMIGRADDSGDHRCVDIDGPPGSGTQSGVVRLRVPAARRGLLARPGYRSASILRSFPFVEALRWV
jgi:hypothetical protein